MASVCSGSENRLDAKCAGGLGIPDSALTSRGYHLLMKVTREELDARLDTLAANVAQMLEGNTEPLKDAIDRAGADLLDDAKPGDIDHVWSRLQCIQRDAGLIPGDDEPCDDGESLPDDDAVSQ